MIAHPPHTNSTPKTDKDPKSDIGRDAVHKSEVEHNEKYKVKRNTLQNNKVVLFVLSFNWICYRHLKGITWKGMKPTTVSKHFSCYGHCDLKTKSA